MIKNLQEITLKVMQLLITKQIFWDLVRFWELYRTPIYCRCGSKFVSLRHNDVRNITATLLKEVCHDVRVEPILQQLTGEHSIIWLT